MWCTQASMQKGFCPPKSRAVSTESCNVSSASPNDDTDPDGSRLVFLRSFSISNFAFYNLHLSSEATASLLPPPLYLKARIPHFLGARFDNLGIDLVFYGLFQLILNMTLFRWSIPSVSLDQGVNIYQVILVSCMSCWAVTLDSSIIFNPNGQIQ